MIKFAQELLFGITATAGTVNTNTIGLSATQKLIDRKAQRFPLGILQCDLEGRNDVPGGTLQRPVVAKRTQVLHPAFNVKAVLANDLRGAKFDNRFEHQRRKNSQITFT